MKKANIFFPVAGIMFLLMLLLATLLYRHSQVDYQSYHQQTELIRNIQKNTAELARDILLVQSGQTYHYDAVAKTLAHNDTLILSLQSNDTNFTPLINAWATFKSFIEDIKSNNAIYQNSLRYFSHGIESLLLDLSADKQNVKIIKALWHLELNFLQFSLGHGKQSTEQLTRQANAFNKMAKSLPKKTANNVAMLSQHVQILLRKYSLLKQLNFQLLNTDIPQQAQLLLHQYDQNFNQTMQQAAKIRTFFYGICLVLMLVVVITIIKLKTILSELHDSEALVRDVADNAPIMLWMSNKKGNLVFLNERLRLISGCKEGNSISTVCLEGIYPDDKNQLRDALQLQQHKTTESLLQIRIKDDQKGCLYWSVRVVARHSEAGEYQGLVCSMADVTQQKLLEEKTQLAAQVFEHSLEGILISDTDNKIVQVNKAFSTLTGYSQKEVLGKSPNLLNSGIQDKAFYQEMWKAINERGFWRGEVYNRRKNKEIYPEWLTITVVKNKAHDITHHIAIFNDITEKKKAEQDIHFLAHFDSLTRLPNRVLFNERMDHAIQQAKRSGRCIAVMFLDLDRFKSVNDSLGHEAGDELLIKVAEDLSRCIRDADTLARIGGDEFTVLLEAVDKDTVYKNCPIVAEKIIQKLSSSYHIKKTQVFIGVSIGIAIYPNDGESIAVLTQHADMAMYHAKDEGRNNFQFYSEQLNDVVQKRLTLEADLRIAIEQQQFFIHYQPQYNLLSKQLQGFEALIRWQHPRLGVLASGEFIPVAEETGLIIDIGKWVLETACHQLTLWQIMTPLALRMAVNISLKQLEKEDFVSCVNAVLDTYNIQPKTLELEVTESMFLEDGSTTLAILKQLDQLGVKLSIDDFGTGYSNMSYLKKLPIDRIKIDRCFINDIPHDENDAAIVRIIIDIAKIFGIKVIAEGIETREQEAYLVEKGCDEGQGFLFNKPLSVSAINTLLEKPLS